MAEAACLRVGPFLNASLTNDLRLFPWKDLDNRGNQPGNPLSLITPSGCRCWSWQLSRLSLVPVQLEPASFGDPEESID